MLGSLHVWKGLQRLESHWVRPQKCLSRKGHFLLDKISDHWEAVPPASVIITANIYSALALCRASLCILSLNPHTSLREAGLSSASTRRTEGSSSLLTGFLAPGSASTALIKAPHAFYFQAGSRKSANAWLWVPLSPSPTLLLTPAPRQPLTTMLPFPEHGCKLSHQTPRCPLPPLPYFPQISPYPTGYS